MSVGTTIFLSSIVLASVILYGITKDRWPWASLTASTARAASTTFVGVIIVSILIGVIFTVESLLPIAPQTAYAGLRLGMGQDEVMYIKGYPPSVLGKAPKAPEAKGPWDRYGWWDDPVVVETKTLGDGQRVQDYRDWSYQYRHSRIDVTFNPEHTAVIAIQCYSHDSLGHCPSIAGASDGNSEQEVIRKLGPPDTSRIDGVAKSLDSRTHGIPLWLTKEQIYMLGIYDPKYISALK
jgi:hypothetical protein